MTPSSRWLYTVDCQQDSPAYYQGFTLESGEQLNHQSEDRDERLARQHTPQSKIHTLSIWTKETLR
jgi:hypothetical protein